MDRKENGTERKTEETKPNEKEDRAGAGVGWVEEEGQDRIAGQGQEEGEQR